MLFRKFSFYLAIAGLAATVRIIQLAAQKPPKPPPLSEPARSPFQNSVAAAGLIEAAHENVRIASPKGGLVTKVFVTAGDPVKARDPLFQLDDREARARIASTEKQVDALRATLLAEDVAIADLTDQVARIARLERDKVASEDERKRREFALDSAKAKVEATRAQIQALGQQAEQARVELEVLTVRTPRDGRVLQANIREGEFAPAAALAEPLMLLGDVDTLQVRADVDEQNAPLVEAGQAAKAFLKGNRELQIPLRFVRIEPYVVPKRSLTGDSLERVDTRVLQIIFAFDRPPFPVYVGQQVDVFIQRSAASPPAVPATNPGAPAVVGQRPSPANRQLN